MGTIKMSYEEPTRIQAFFSVVEAITLLQEAMLRSSTQPTLKAHKRSLLQVIHVDVRA